jgi:hypothetical protein
VLVFAGDGQLLNDGRQVMRMFALASLLISLSANAQPIFYDGFESGNTSHSVGGFRWQKNNRTSVVSADGVVWNNGPKNVPISEGKNWSAHDGKFSLRFRYPAAAAGKDGMAEQRFVIGAAQSDVWIQYWVRVPPNYWHRDEKPSNNKWLALWTNKYSTPAFTIWSLWSDGAGGSDLTWSGTGARGHQDRFKAFIKPADAGRWMQFVARVKLSSAQDQADGIIQAWRRWQEDPAFTLLQSRKDLIIWPSAGPLGFTTGYLLGWANSGYDEETEFLIDDFELTAEPLVPTVSSVPISSRDANW